MPTVVFNLLVVRVAEHLETTSYWVQFAAMQIGLGPPVGIGVGYIGGKLIERSAIHKWISHSFSRTDNHCSGIGCLWSGGVGRRERLYSGLLAGQSVGNVSRSICLAIHEFAEAEGQLLTLLVFFVFGAVLIAAGLRNLTFTGMLFAILALTVLRMLPVAISLFGTRLRGETRWFIGWFGPRGVASIVFALVLLKEIEVPARHDIFAIAMATVALSVFCHGLTAYPLAKWYAVRTERAKEISQAAEHEPIVEMPFR
ncbi:MAG: cation:proton antiporter [Pirellulaceae bacterium]